MNSIQWALPNGVHTVDSYPFTLLQKTWVPGLEALKKIQILKPRLQNWPNDK